MTLINRADYRSGAVELCMFLRDCRAVQILVLVFSLMVNLLMLIGPVYMLNIHDRVLTTGSMETLVALSVIAGVLFLFMGLLDAARSRLLARLGARLQVRAEPRILEAALRAAAIRSLSGLGAQAPADLDSIRRLMSAPMTTAVLDLTFAPLFFGALFLLHPWLGLLALGATGTLVISLTLGRWLMRPTQNAAQLAEERAQGLAQYLQFEGDTIVALGMTGALSRNWAKLRAASLKPAISLAENAARLGAMTLALRLAVQSAALGLGAALVLRAEMGAGAMFAATILLARALAPFDMLAGRWDLVSRAKLGWRNLSILLTALPPEAGLAAAPSRQHTNLRARGLGVAAPGETLPILRGVEFELAPGQAMAVIGPAGAGKSTLARVLVGLVPAAEGGVLLDGQDIAHLPRQVLARIIGYLPQRVVVFPGSIAENIARMDPDAEPGSVRTAAQAAGLHLTIERLRDGYATRLDTSGAPLSGGQIEALGLARALYGDPPLLVLDEPETGLDARGAAILTSTVDALREAGRSLVIITHHARMVAHCDLVLRLADGRAQGPDPLLPQPAPDGGAAGDSEAVDKTGGSASAGQPGPSTPGRHAIHEGLGPSLPETSHPPPPRGRAA